MDTNHPGVVGLIHLVDGVPLGAQMAVYREVCPYEEHQVQPK